MTRGDALRALTLGVCVATAILAVPSCGPRELEPRQVVPPAVRAGCILLRAFTDDGRLDEVCATAEDLAPLFGELLAEHEKNSSPEQKNASPLLAFTLAPPKKPAPRRRCAQWVTLSASDGGAPEGGDGGR